MWLMKRRCTVPPLDQGTLVLACGLRVLGFPGEAVREIRNWQAPRPLPGAAPWLGGLLSEDGVPWPFLRTNFWGESPKLPEVFVLLAWGERVLAVPGRDPWMVRPTPPSGPPEWGDGPWAGTMEAGGMKVALVDLRQLYLMLGLH